MKDFKFVNIAAFKEFKKLPQEVQLQIATSINAVAQGERPLLAFESLSKQLMG